MSLMLAVQWIELAAAQALAIWTLVHLARRRRPQESAGREDRVHHGDLLRYLLGAVSIILYFAGSPGTTTLAWGVLPWTAALLAYRVHRLLYRIFRNRSTITPPGTPKVPPTGRDRSHLNVDWSPKIAYASLREAQQVADRQGEQEHSVLSAYRCPVCECFHVGHNRVS